MEEDKEKNPETAPGNTSASEPASAQKAVAGSRGFFSLWKIILPVAIGVGVVVMMFIHDARKEDLAEVWRHVQFDTRAVLCIILAFLFMFGRDFGLSWRFRALTDKKLSWPAAFEVDFLCEFTSCVTPSAVGGSSLGGVYLYSKGIDFGRATTLMMTTLILDELFFVVACPFVIFLTPGDEIFSSGGATFSHGIKLTFWIVYAVLFLWTFILFTGIIWKPQWIQKVISRLFRLRWLRRWQSDADGLAANMMATSAELRTKPFGFWAEVFCGTALSWLSRYLVVNALFLGFVATADHSQWLILARQFVIWVVLMISPTPGGSGLSEWLFSEYYADLVTSAGMALILAVFWRVISYYLYLGIGAVIVPGWLRGTIGRFHHTGNQQKQ